MAAPGPDGNPQMHMGGPSQMQHPQIQQQIQAQMMGQPHIIRQVPVQMTQGGGIVRMQPAGLRQRPQMAKPHVMQGDQQPGAAYIGGMHRVSSFCVFLIRCVMLLKK